MEKEVDKYHSCLDWLSFTARKPERALSPVKKERPVPLNDSVFPWPPPPAPSTETSSRATSPGH